MRRRALVVVLFAACGRFHFDPRLEATGDATDATIDATTVPSCWQAWRDGTVSLSAPQPLTTLNTATYHADPSLSFDALELYFARGGAQPDVFIATRVDRASPFSGATLVAELSSTGDEGKVTLSDNGLNVFWSTERMGSMGFDLWYTLRFATTDPFTTPPTQLPLGPINDAMQQYDPHLSSDQLRLYYAPEQAGVQSVVVSTRPTAGGTFGAPVGITDLGPGVAADPALSPDELVIVFSHKPTNPDPFRLFYATRASTAMPFGNAREIPAVNVFVHQQDPALSQDGCELFFSGKTGGTQQDLYVSRVQ